jgi:hypothetical protein
MADLSKWLEAAQEARDAWEEIRREYYAQIRAINETAEVKIELRNLADWCVETAIDAEQARAINHRRSAAVFQRQGNPDGRHERSKYIGTVFGFAISNAYS